MLLNLSSRKILLHKLTSVALKIKISTISTPVTMSIVGIYLDKRVAQIKLASKFGQLGIKTLERKICRPSHIRLLNQSI